MKLCVRAWRETAWYLQSKESLVLSLCFVTGHWVPKIDNSQLDFFWLIRWRNYFILMRVDLRSKPSVCSRLIAGNVGSNTNEGIEISVSRACCVLCRYWPLWRADHSFRGVLPVMCAQLCVIYNLKTRLPMPYWAIAPQKKNYNWMYPKSNKIWRKIWKPYQENIQYIHYKNSYTCNIIHNAESTAAWNLNPER
jgi:hypothetical protein